MYKQFSTLEALYQEIDRDKNVSDAGIANANRYPLRFVMFENFRDFYAFVRKCAEKGMQVVGIEKWLDPQFRDTYLTYSCLARKIREYISRPVTQDAVIAPFSELARFYPAEEFRSLVTTIRLCQASDDSQNAALRIYVPLIGMQGKMDSFRSDNAIRIWGYHAAESEKRYRLILCPGTCYGVTGANEQYDYCGTVQDWVSLWKQGNVRTNIICYSKSIFDNVGNAQPDNAFDYTICQNAFEFLREGLKLIPKDIQCKVEELPHWETLASEIKDVRSFRFEDFVLTRFNVRQLEESEFMQFWFKWGDAFSRWLLKTYFLMKFCEGKYLCRVLMQCERYQSTELFDKLALQIFAGCNAQDLSERRVLLSKGRDQGISLTVSAESELRQKLVDMAENPEYGYTEAMKYMTPLTDTEKHLMIEWLGLGKIDRESIATLLPDLYTYTAPMPSGIFGDSAWLDGYFKEYRASKVSNKLAPGISELLGKYNNSTASFESWKNTFKTVKTILLHREDIEIYYWIDGLGVDWIPFIMHLMEEHKNDGIYLNEVYIGTSLLPTATAINKLELEGLPHTKLEKAGDIDELAHKWDKYPDFICKELQAVREAVTKVIRRYNGKKIAFVSDHGISYMAQHGRGLSLSGAVGGHDGRCATWRKGAAPYDSKYVIAADGKTICSLTHDSLAAKTPFGHGAHGGATPEEVLVPVFVVSGQSRKTTYAARLLQTEVTANDPVVRYELKGVSTMDVPKLQYDGQLYAMRRVHDGTFVSERLNLRESAGKVILSIGDFSQTDFISVKTGADEIDLFEGL